MGTLSDPDLDVDFLLPEGEVIAFNAVDHAAAEVFHVSDIGHQRIKAIRRNQIGGRQRPFVFFPQYVDQVIDCPGNLDLGVEVCFVAEQGQRFSVEQHLDIRMTAGACGADLAGPVEGEGA